ncbi:MAG: peptidase, partial [Verrucomicrobiia bacterium]
GSTNVWTAADEAMVTEIRNKIIKNPPNRQGNPAIAETVMIEITLAPDAEPGEREIRLGAPNGLSNPLLICVGQLPEFSKPPAKAVSPQLERFLKQLGGQSKTQSPKSEMSITLPAVVNGQIMPGGVDRFRFSANKGQQLVAIVNARELIPYLADAVPGWFQATLALYDAKGNELAYDDHFRFNPDPVLYYEIPADGEYVMEIKDSIYRGREDFVYRITVGELPFITSIFPLGGPAGALTTIALKGWNLPVTNLTLSSMNITPGIYPVSVRKEKWISNVMPFKVDTLPECMEREPNNEPATALPVTLPIIVNGRIDQPGDVDVFQFDSRAGNEIIVAEVYARRLNSPLDSVLRLTDANGKQLAFNDDHEDKGFGLNTHYADSWLSAKLPTIGTYYLYLWDAQHNGGPEYGYRLRISQPRPDFDLRAVPSSINARPGVTNPITIYAIRRDGFSDAITVALKGAPLGFKLNGGPVPAYQDHVQLTLTVPSTPLKDPIDLNLEGRAMIQGRDVVHPVVPAEDMMQAFAYRHLVPAKELKVAVAGRQARKAWGKIISATPIKLRPGGLARVQVELPKGVSSVNVQPELSGTPEGIIINGFWTTRDVMEIALQSDVTKVKLGQKGNLTVKVFGQKTGAHGKDIPQTNNQRIQLGTLPSIPFEIVER